MHLHVFGGFVLQQLTVLAGALCGSRFAQEETVIQKAVVVSM
jgi:acyl-CoA hydrolase